MAIYKSSFNKKPEKQQEKQPKQKPQAEKKPSKKIKVNHTAIWLVVFLCLFIVCCCPSNFVKNMVLGLIGLSIYPICVVGMLICSFKLAKCKFVAKRKYVVYLSVTVGIVWFIFHLILTSRLDVSSYGAFLAETYKAKTTAGGLLFSLISWPITKVLTLVGAYIFSVIALAVFVGLIIDYINKEKEYGKAEKKTKFDFKNIEEFQFDQPDQPQVDPEEETKKLAKRRLGLEKGETTIISSSMPTININERKTESRPINKREYILTPIEPIIPPDVSSDIFLNSTSGYSRPKQEESAQPQPTPIQEDKPVEIQPNIMDEIMASDEDSFATDLDQDLETNFDDDFMLSDDEIDETEYSELQARQTDEQENGAKNFNADELPNLSESYEAEEKYSSNESYEYADEQFEEIDKQDQTEHYDVDLDKQDYVDEFAYNPHSDNLGSTVETEVVRPSVDISKFNLPKTVKKTLIEEPEQLVIEQPKQKQEIPPYVAPPVELLNYLENTYHISDDELQDNIIRLEQVLEDFKVPAKVNNVQVGPAVTRYELTMPRGISVNKIAQMADDIAMTLASNGSIRVEAPIPGKNSVGVEVPNAQVSSVSLRELIDSEQFRQRGNPLSFVLGKDINGDIIFCNLDKMPHVLVAGSTGSGKSVCLNTMLLSMCYKAGPQDLRLILVDPKMVEFTQYNGLPHLLLPEVITGKEMTINALDWAIKEMERRYALFAKHRVVNIGEFNKLEIVKNKTEDKIPYIVIVVDELADLMLEAKREIEDRIARLAAKARAAGIHLVLATQRPSVDVITGTVKANLPSRIAFALTNYMDSKTVLDGGGAEKLLGKGDMLFKPLDKPEPKRIQGAFVSNSEIAEVVEYIKQHNKPVYDEDTGRTIKNPHQAEKSSSDVTGAREMEFDPVLKDALKVFIQNKQASGSMISRRYSVGFNRAGRIMDQMERAGFIGPQEGSKPRQVLITMDEYNAIFGDE